MKKRSVVEEKEGFQKAKKNLEDFEKIIAPFSKKPLKRTKSFEKWSSISPSLDK